MAHHPEGVAAETLRKFDVLGGEEVGASPSCQGRVVEAPCGEEVGLGQWGQWGTGSWPGGLGTDQEERDEEQGVAVAKGCFHGMFSLWRDSIEEGPFLGWPNSEYGLIRWARERGDEKHLQVFNVLC